MVIFLVGIIYAAIPIWEEGRPPFPVHERTPQDVYA